LLQGLTQCRVLRKLFQAAMALSARCSAHRSQKSESLPGALRPLRWRTLSPDTRQLRGALQSTPSARLAQMSTGQPHRKAQHMSSPEWSWTLLERVMPGPINSLPGPLLCGCQPTAQADCRSCVRSARRALGTGFLRALWRGGFLAQAMLVTIAAARVPWFERQHAVIQLWQSGVLGRGFGDEFTVTPTALKIFEQPMNLGMRSSGSRLPGSVRGQPAEPGLCTTARRCQRAAVRHGQRDGYIASRLSNPTLSSAARTRRPIFGPAGVP